MWQLIIAIGGVYLVKGIIDSFSEDSIPQRRIFISHSWRKSESDYKKFIKKLKLDKVDFFNHSIPIEKAFATKDRRKLEQIFRKQMVYCSKVFVLAKSGISSTSYVATEIRIAQELGKEIIAVKPHGQIGIPSFIKRKADIVISNNINSITRVLKDEL